ncbi:MAG: MtnX-like HAD-IB family phosphatase [Bacillota bacterium]
MSDRRTASFWAASAGAPLVILTDFDYTITTVDVGDLLVEKLCPPSPESLRRFWRKEIGSRLIWLDSMARVNPTEGRALADGVTIDPHFRRFVEWTAAQGIPLAVVSDGFTFYIEQILRRESLDHLPVFANEWVSPGELAWPHANPACDWCGCCKAAVARRLRAAGSQVVFMGDGVSDLYAAGFADYIFARGRLAHHLEEQGSPFFPLDSFEEPLMLLRQHLERFQRGSMERRSTLRAHPQCRFPEGVSHS